MAFRLQPQAVIIPCPYASLYLPVPARFHWFVQCYSSRSGFSPSSALSPCRGDSQDLQRYLLICVGRCFPPQWALFRIGWPSSPCPQTTRAQERGPEVGVAYLASLAPSQSLLLSPSLPSPLPSSHPIQYKQKKPNIQGLAVIDVTVHSFLKLGVTDKSGCRTQSKCIYLRNISINNRYKWHGIFFFTMSVGEKKDSKDSASSCRRSLTLADEDLAIKQNLREVY